MFVYKRGKSHVFALATLRFVATKTYPTGSSMSPGFEATSSCNGETVVKNEWLTRQRTR